MTKALKGAHGPPNGLAHPIANCVSELLTHYTSPTSAFLNDKRTSCEAPVAVEYAVTLLF
jgi:hypothetical protein